MQHHLHKTIKRQFGIGYNQLRGMISTVSLCLQANKKRDFLLHVANFLPIIFIPYFPSPPRNIMLQFAFGSSRFQWTDTKGWVREQKKLMMSSHSCSIQHGISIIVKSCILENAKIARVGRVEAISFIMAKKIYPFARYRLLKCSLIARRELVT